MLHLNKKALSTILEEEEKFRITRHFKVTQHTEIYFVVRIEDKNFWFATYIYKVTYLYIPHKKNLFGESHYDKN